MTTRAKPEQVDSSSTEANFSTVSDPAFPRIRSIEKLLRVIRQQPKLSKDASSALADLEKAIHPSVSYEELSVLMRGALMQEVYVRNSCLQTLQLATTKTNWRIGTPDEVKLEVAERILVWLSSEVARLAKRGSPRSEPGSAPIPAIVCSTLPPSFSSSYASSDLFVLLSWSCGIYTVCAKASPEFSSTNVWRVLVGSMATLLDMLSASTKAKTSMLQGALVRVRRALRSAPEELPTLISTLLAISKSSQAPLRMASLLGVAVSVLVRLKNVDDEPSKRLPQELKDEIIASCASNVLMSKVVVPSHISDAYNDFIRNFVSEKDFTETILPAIEKALLRSPEIFLPTLQDSPPPPSTRRPLSSRGKRLLALPKSDKTAGPDHRVALYSMLAVLPPSPSVSGVLIQTATLLLAKETHEGATAVLASALPARIIFILTSGPIASEIMHFIAKEMGSAKPGVRRAFCVLAGTVLTGGLDFSSGPALEFAKAVVPALEGSLKTVAGNPLGASGGPLEAHIAAAVLLGPLARTGKFSDVIRKNATLGSIAPGSTKASFLLWDKVSQKLTDPVDEAWLLKAWEAAFTYFKAEFAKSEVLRSQLGLVSIHLTLEGSAPEVRREVNTVVERCTALLPELTNRVVRDGLNTFLSRGMPLSKPTTSSSAEETTVPWNKHSRLSVLLLSVVSFPEGTDLKVREDMIVELIILGHHHLVCGNSRQTWIDLCQRARADPYDLTNKHLDKLLKLILGASTVDAKYGFADASCSAASTLVFVAPEPVLPRVMEQLKVDINPAVINSLTELDIGIWLTPEGTTYTDVLADKGETKISTKGKDHEIAKWEEEIRKTLAAKKAAATKTLTKQQQALVTARLEEEAKIRQHVAGIQANLRRGLRFVKSLVASGVQQFRAQISLVASLLLEGALGRGTILVGKEAFDTYLELAKCSSERLDTFRSWVGVAALRSLKIEAVPEELQSEPLNRKSTSLGICLKLTVLGIVAIVLLLRVLYRLRSLSEQAPFDAATFSYAYPLLGQVLLQGGLAVEEEEEALEQVALSLATIKFHCGEFSDPAFPRIQTMEKPSPHLREAVHSSVSDEELSVLMRGTLMQEVYVRNSCLQTLQPSDLTDLDWSPELLIACHDEDEQNARLARHLWEDNGLDVPEQFLDALLHYLGHDNAYVRSSVAAAIAEGVEHWPQTIQKTVIVLQDFYREKGMVISQSLDRTDPWPARLAIARTFELRVAANRSLKQFGEVISNPEIQSLVPVLLKALVDPAKAPNTLGSLLKTSFMHYIDHSSLALIVPIITRGLRERGADTKKKAAQIVGNLASLTDSKDFIPYLAELLPMVHLVLIDPVPEARATAAKALSTLVERLGEIHFPDLVPGLLRTLKTDISGVDRQGAAQGPSKVLSGPGLERLEGLLPDIITNAQSPRPTVREGFLSLLVFLPATFGTRFQPHLPKIIVPILSGLSDVEEYVREAAMRARRMVQSSVTLVGKLLFKVSGISGKTSDLDEEEVAIEATTAETSRRALGAVLGAERRDRILSALYLVRQDGVVVVRQSSIQIWKALVHNTRRPVREILPELVNQILHLISGDEFEQQETAARTTTELSRKFGEKILNDIIPILTEKSTSLDARTREGICLMLSEIIEGHEDEIISIVRISLVGDEPNVRSAAAKAFDILQEHLGAKAIDQTIPPLLETLRQLGKGSGTALEALCEVMSVRASTVFPVLIPALAALAVTLLNARALTALAAVAGNALSKRLTVILNSLVKTWEDEQGEELRDVLDETIRSLFVSVGDAEGPTTLMMVLLGWVKSETPKRRASGCKFFAIFCEESELDSPLYLEVHAAAWEALDTFVQSIPKDELLEGDSISQRSSERSSSTINRTSPVFSNVPTTLLRVGLLNVDINDEELRGTACHLLGALCTFLKCEMSPIAASQAGFIPENSSAFPSFPSGHFDFDEPGSPGQASQSRTLYMRKEFVERQALKERIDEGIKEDEAWHQFQQIVDAPVIYAHPFDLPYVASEILVIQWYIPYMDLQHVLIVGA
ncbi:armadillo-type protein [Lyophyllum atratum]|nr:armadillo-type protein [Lyophyllum atratum]